MKACMRKLGPIFVIAWVVASCGERTEESLKPGRDTRSDTAPPVMAAAPDSMTPPALPPRIPAVTASPVQPGEQPAGDTTVTGVIRAVGAMPLAQTVVQTAEGDVALAGPLKDELARVVGAEVRVRGKPVANAPPAPRRAIEVSAYEIVQFNGQRPVVGRLVEREDTHHIEVTRTEIVRLAALPGELATLVGRRVWVVGEQGPNGLRVQVFGESRPLNH